MEGQQKPERLRVLYIGGWGRSGSTLLDRMLGEVRGFAAVGEMRFIWERGVLMDCLCGCGARFSACPFWRRVGEEAFGGWDRVDVDEMIRLDRSVDRLWYLPLLLAPSLSSRFRARLEAYARALARLYTAIANVSGASVVVDSTKDPPFAFVLRRVPGLDLRVLHLVRDSRGVVFAWTKHVRRAEVIGGEAYMDRYHPAHSSLRWMLFNALFHVLASLGVPRLFMRYEALVESPRVELARAVAHAGEPVDGTRLTFVDGRSVELGAHHAVAGNPMRMRHGTVSLRLDREWTEKMPAAQRRLVSLLTLPLLFAYGYVGRGASRQR